MVLILLAVDASAAERELEPQPESAPRLLLSDDGVRFEQQLAGPILADVGPMVPGDRIEDRVWARNASDEPATLTVDIARVRSTVPVSAGDADQFWLSATTAVEPASTLEPNRTPLVSTSDCQRLHTVSLLPGEDHPVDLTIGLGFDASNATQTQHVNLDLTVSLYPTSGYAEGEVAAGCAPGRTDPSESAVGMPAPGQPEWRGDLPRTGASLLALLAFAGGLLVTGAAVHRLVRHRSG